LQLQGKNDEAAKFTGRSKTASLRPAPAPARAQKPNSYTLGTGAYQSQIPPQNYQAPQSYKAPQAYQPRASAPSTMPLGQDGTLNSEQQAVLARLARGLGPKPSGPQMAGPAPAAQQAYPNTSRQPAPQASYAPSVQSDKSGRAPNRRRR